MNTFIPLDLYYPVYINICLFLVLFSLLHTRILDLNDPKNLKFINGAGYFLLGFLLFYIGQRPISGYFGDTVNYAYAYNKYVHGGQISDGGDMGWDIFMHSMAQIVSIHTFFSLVAFIYIFPMYKLSKQLFKGYWYYAFVMFIVSFSFYTYAVNGIRNGAACSLFLWGLCYRDKKVVMAIFFVLAISFHKTLALPILAYLATYIYNKPKTYFTAWLASIPLSLVMGGSFIILFTSLGFGDERLTGYLTGEVDAGAFKSTGFRWDFLFHSAFAVFAGWYFIFKKGFSDTFYNQLLNTYLICNCFWILVITANYSNRFAYLSWFMMAIVVIYPLLKKEMFRNQHFLIGKVVMVYFAFTYLMYYVYYAPAD